jgi:hypothetical protein
MDRKRVREISMLVLHRHRGLPDNPRDRRMYLEAAAHHLKPKNGDLAFALENWALRVGGKPLPGEIEHIVRKVAAKPRRFKADTLGSILNVSYAERCAARLTTIGCYDVPKAERTKRRRQRDRERKQLRRRKNGAISRMQYLANAISRKKPWSVEGISRRTWYRRRNQLPAWHKSVHTTLVFSALDRLVPVGFASGLPPAPARASRASLTYSMEVPCSV